MKSLRAILVGIALVTGIGLTAVSSAQVKNTGLAQGMACCASECHKASKNGQAHGEHGDHHEAKTVECSMDGPDCCKHDAKAEHKASAHAGARGEALSCCGGDGCCKEGGECAMTQHGTSATQNEKTDSCCATCECCKDQSCCSTAKKDEKG
jgi:hypothetical protein